MNPTELPIKDIHLPDPVSWWPPAVGWWILAVMLPVAVLILIWLYKRMTRKTALKAAKKYLAAIKQDTSRDDYQKLCAISILIRRMAISHFPRTETASLVGKPWLQFLEASMSDKRFSEGVGQLLLDVPYRKAGSEDLKIGELIQLCEDWLQALSRNKK